MTYGKFRTEEELLAACQTAINMSLTWLHTRIENKYGPIAWLALASNGGGKILGKRDSTLFEFESIEELLDHLKS